MKPILLVAILSLLFSCSMNQNIRFVRTDHIKTEKSTIQSKPAKDEAKSVEEIERSEPSETIQVIEVIEEDQEEVKRSTPTSTYETLADESLSNELVSYHEADEIQHVKTPSETTASDSQSSQRMSDLSRVLLIILFTIIALVLLFLVLLLAFLVGWNSGSLITILIIPAGLAIIVGLYIWALRLIS